MQMYNISKLLKEHDNHSTELFSFFSQWNSTHMANAKCGRKKMVADPMSATQSESTSPGDEVTKPVIPHPG